MLALPVATLPFRHSGQNGTVGGGVDTAGDRVTGASVGGAGTFGQPQTLPAAAAAWARAHCSFVTPPKTNVCAWRHVMGVPGNGPNNAMIPSGFCKSKPPSRHRLQLMSGCNVGNRVGMFVGGDVGAGVGSDVGRGVGKGVGSDVVG